MTTNGANMPPTPPTVHFHVLKMRVEESYQTTRNAWRPGGNKGPKLPQPGAIEGGVIRRERNGANRNVGFDNGCNPRCTTPADNQPYGLFGAGAQSTFDVHQPCVEAQRLNAAVQW